tara:strand:+ start:123 stop:890 length:768 start_codon:yes stop_codon:yes gene_type:complete
MTKKIYYYFILFFVLGIETACSQTPKTYAEDFINTDQLTESLTKWYDHLYIVLRDTLNERKILRVYHSTMNPSKETMNSFDNDILEYETLRPLVKHQTKGTLTYDYSENNKVIVNMINEKDTIVKEVNLTHHNYVMSGPSSGVLTNALPLKYGFKTHFQSLNINFPYRQNDTEIIIDEYTLEVIGDEIISFDGKTFDCFVVEIQSDRLESVYMKRWVTKTLPHQDLKWIYTFKKEDGSHINVEPRRWQGLPKSFN